VAVGTVSRAQSFTADATWATTSSVRNASQGTITSVNIADGDLIDPGTKLYEVNLRPIVAALGRTPAFRTLSAGSIGSDVAQLQRFLIKSGQYHGRASGKFDGATASAVRSWQRQIGVEADGTVRLGDIVFFQKLPTRVALADALRTGESVSGGEPVINVLADAPTFSVTLSQDQAASVPLTGPVLVDGSSGSWNGVIASSNSANPGELVLTLQGQGGAPLCGTECGAVPVVGTSHFRCDLIIVPETSGPLVPIAAVQSRPDGSAFVVDSAGKEITVRLIATAEGRAIVEGLAVDQIIRLFGASTGPDPSRQP